jgi:hypothetical protein
MTFFVNVAIVRRNEELNVFLCPETMSAVAGIKREFDSTESTTTTTNTTNTTNTIVSDAIDKKPKLADSGDEVAAILARLTEFVAVGAKRQKALQSAAKLIERNPPVVRAEHAANVATLVGVATEGVADQIVCHDLHAEYAQLVDVLLTRRDTAAATLDAARLDDLRFRCCVSHALHTEDSFEFGSALSVLRAEVLRCCDALQRAKLDDADAPADVTASRAAALFGALSVVHLAGGGACVATTRGCAAQGRCRRGQSRAAVFHAGADRCAARLAR